MNLVTTLSAFNRKERFWLLRLALGDAQFALGEDFRKELVRSLPTIDDVPPDAWWAMDYHIDWLAAALHQFYDKDNSSIFTNHSSEDGSRPDTYFLSGTQQDVDLIVSFGEHLVLCEAKAGTGWDSRQARAKLERLDGLQKFAKKFESEERVKFHYVLISPTKPTQLVQNAEIEGFKWPDWAKVNGEAAHIALDFGYLGAQFSVAKRTNKTGEIYNRFEIFKQAVVKKRGL